MAGKNVDLARLCSCIDRSRYVMQFFREERMRGVKQLAGHRYSTQGALKKTFVNAISMYVNIVGRNLISKNPKVTLSTFEKDSKPVVKAMESWVNAELVRTKFADTMQRIVLDALFSIGIAKVSLATPSDSAVMGWGLDAGQAFISHVDLDDFVFDHHARDMNELSYIGHRHRAPLATIADSKLYNKKARDRLTASWNSQYNRQGDEKIGNVGRGYFGQDEDFEDMVDLWEIYVPRHRCVYTFSEDDFSGPSGVWEGGTPVALREQDWIGPDTGPYHILGFEYIPGNPMPKGPIQDLIELHEALNESYRKLVRQAARTKKMTAYQRENSEDAARIQAADDGGLVGLSSPQSVQEMKTGGTDPDLMLFMRECYERFNMMAGNLTTMGGLAPEAGTLGQEQLLAAQSNGQVASMQDVVVALTQSVIGPRGLLWYWWNDPSKVMETKFDGLNMPGAEIVRKIVPWNHPDNKALKRDGKIPDLKVDPFSMRAKSPGQLAKDLTGIVTQIYVPMAQLAMQQGVTLDLNALFGILSKYMDMPDLQTILSVTSPPQQQTVGGATAGGTDATKPPETTRNYVRRSLGGGSAQAKNAGMESKLEAASSNGQQ